MTKVMKLQLEVDEEELRDNWANNRYEGDEALLAQGQAMYIEGLKTLIGNRFNYND